MKFFVDNCLPPRLARAFNEIAKPNNEFVHLREHTGLVPNATDLEWIALLAQEAPNWAVITRDKNIMKKPAEKAAFREANLTGFFLDASWGKLDFWEQLSKLSALMPTIIKLALESPPGTCFKVPIRAKEIKRL